MPTRPFARRAPAPCVTSLCVSAPYTAASHTGATRTGLARITAPGGTAGPIAGRHTIASYVVKLAAFATLVSLTTLLLACAGATDREPADLPVLLERLEPTGTPPPAAA
jgi:hypothetical protein